MELRNPNDGDGFPAPFVEDLHRLSFSGANSAEGGGAGGGAGGYFFSCPSSPVHYVLSSPPYSFAPTNGASWEAFSSSTASGSSFEFDGPAEADGSMISADELFLNGRIQPVKLLSKMHSSHVLSPLMDLDDEYDEDVDNGDRDPEAPAEEGDDGVVRGRDLRSRSRSVHRRTRSMSPLRSPRLRLQKESEQADSAIPPEAEDEASADNDRKPPQESESLESPASSSRCSSTGRNSKRWDFIKDLLRRSKSEGSGRGANAKDRFWHSISFSPSSSSSKSKPPLPPSSPAPSTSPASERPTDEEPKEKQKKPGNGMAGSGRQRRGLAPPSPHERLYTANRAQSEEMRHRTFLPYRQGLLLGCLGFNSRSYGAFHGFAKTLNTVSSR